MLSRTSPLGFHGGSGCLELTSAACVSPPAPDVATPPAPPGTGLWCPRQQTPGWEPAMGRQVRRGHNTRNVTTAY